jgi:hypothetical protein
VLREIIRRRLGILPEAWGRGDDIKGGDEGLSVCVMQNAKVR